MITRSIKKEYKQLWKPVLGFFLLLPLLALISFWAKDKMALFLDKMPEWPEELLAFFGMTGLYQGNPGLLVFYLGLIFTTMFAMAVCVNSADMMSADEEEGVTIFYVNQPYTKTQIFFIRLAWYLLSALLRWGVYIGSVAVSLTFLCGKLKIASEAGLKLVWAIGWKGLPFLLFACGIAVVYSMVPFRDMSYRNFVLAWYFIAFVIGNVYKVTDYVVYLMQLGQEDFAAIAQISEKLELLRCVYPFTLLNVLNTEKNPLPGLVPVVYIGLGLALLAIGWWRYEKKSLVKVTKEKN